MPPKLEENIVSRLVCFALVGKISLIKAPNSLNRLKGRCRPHLVRQMSASLLMDRCLPQLLRRRHWCNQMDQILCHLHPPLPRDSLRLLQNRRESLTMAINRTDPHRPCRCFHVLPVNGQVPLYSLKLSRKKHLSQGRPRARSLMKRNQKTLTHLSARSLRRNHLQSLVSHCSVLGKRIKTRVPRNRRREKTIARLAKRRDYRHLILVLL